MPPSISSPKRASGWSSTEPTSARMTRASPGAMRGRPSPGSRTRPETSSPCWMRVRRPDRSGISPAGLGCPGPRPKQHARLTPHASRPQKETIVTSTTTDDFSIPGLRAVIGGRVITPDDAEYDEARTVVAGGIDRRPLVIVRPANADDVAHVVNVARETG